MLIQGSIRFFLHSLNLKHYLYTICL